MKGLIFDIFARDKSAQAFAKLNQNVEESNKKFNKLKGMIGGFTGLLAGGLAVNFFKGVAEGAANIDDLSNRLKVSAEELSRYQFIAERGGVELESVAKAMQKMGVNAVAAANGNKTIGDTLRGLGIDAMTFKDLGMDEQFALIADKIQGIENPSERVKIAMDLMGKSGAEMLQVMEGGGEAFLAMRDRADELGVTINKVQAVDLAEMMDAFDDVGYATKGLATDFLAFLAPAITKVVNAVAWAISQFQVFDGGMTKIGWGLVKLGNQVGVVSDEMYELATIEAYERINKEVKQTNTSLGEQDELLEKIKGSMRQTPVESKKMAEKVIEANTEIKESAEETGDAWSDSLKGISLDFKDLKGSAISALEQIGQSLLKNVLNATFGNSGSTGTGFDIGGSLKGIAGGIGDWLGGFFAEGGNFMGGKPIVVGERGPEVIMPRAGGSVIPNHALGGNTNVTMNISTPDANSFRRSQSQIAAQMAQAVQQGNRNL